MILAFRAVLKTMCLGAALLLLRDPACARSHKLDQIEGECQELRSTLANSTPFTFVGPDPWTEMEEIPASMPGEAVAFVYATGTDIRWVFFRILSAGPEAAGEGWSEDIEYCFRSDGTLAKRLRHVEDPQANVVLEVTSYYEGGKVLKESTHHHSLSRGRQDLTNFSDPDAPVFWTTDQLPFPEITDLSERLG